MEVKESEDKGLGFPLWVAKFRKIGPQDPFFSAGNAERELLAKQVLSSSSSASIDLSLFCSRRPEVFSA